MMGDEDQEGPRRGYLLLWMLRTLLHTIIKPVVLVVMAVRSALRPKAVRYGLLVLLVAGGIGWNYASKSLHEQQIAATMSGETVSTTAASQLPPSPTVESYLKSQANFDANGMWTAIGDDLKSQLQTSGASPQELQAQLDSAKQSGRRYAGATYVGGVPMNDGSSVYFYVLSVEAPTGSAQVPYIYVVGPDGKIASIQ